MTTLSRQKILEKLEGFREYLGYLRQLQKEAESEQAFVSDFHLFGNTERYLQLCIQGIIDVLNLMIIDLGLERPEDNYEAISILFDKSIISEDLANKLTSMVGLRNILVHEYGKIDRKKVYAILIEDIDDLEQFQREITKFLT
jgi:uncharacterized protein YutE (UPF0331/DUF86 family)